MVAQTPQLTLAFAMGVVSTMSAVCYTPTIAQVTNTRNRAFGFSFYTATLIGIGTLAGFIGGHLPIWLEHVQVRRIAHATETRGRY